MVYEDFEVWLYCGLAEAAEAGGSMKHYMHVKHRQGNGVAIICKCLLPCTILGNLGNTEQRSLPMLALSQFYFLCMASCDVVDLPSTWLYKTVLTQMFLCSYTDTKWKKKTSLTWPCKEGPEQFSWLTALHFTMNSEIATQEFYGPRMLFCACKQ